MRMNLGVRQREVALPANRREAPGKSWRAHREIKRYAGGSEHCTVADECVYAAGNGAAAESDHTAAAADESDRTGASAACVERHHGTGRVAAGSATEDD